jgi:FMN phosphatase YigB (HAD superfamily)
MSKYKWARRVKRGEPYFECSSKGDKRYSALYAKVDGKSIEEIYQLDIKGYRSETDNWLDAKKKPPKNKTIEEAYEEYKELWVKYFKENPELLEEIQEKAKNKTITDMFGVSQVNQARAICEILNDDNLVKEILSNKK